MWIKNQAPLFSGIEIVVMAILHCLRHQVKGYASIILFSVPNTMRWRSEVSCLSSHSCKQVKRGRRFKGFVQKHSLRPYFVQPPSGRNDLKLKGSKICARVVTATLFGVEREKNKKMNAHHWGNG